MIFRKAEISKGELSPACSACLQKSRVHCASSKTTERHEEVANIPIEINKISIQNTHSKKGSTNKWKWARRLPNARRIPCRNNRTLHCNIKKNGTTTRRTFWGTPVHTRALQVHGPNIGIDPCVACRTTSVFNSVALPPSTLLPSDYRLFFKVQFVGSTLQIIAGVSNSNLLILGCIRIVGPRHHYVLHRFLDFVFRIYNGSWRPGHQFKRLFNVFVWRFRAWTLHKCVIDVKMHSGVIGDFCFSDFSAPASTLQKLAIWWPLHYIHMFLHFRKTWFVMISSFFPATICCIDSWCVFE